MATQRGKLYIVATPIGNLEDMTYRAVRILQEEVSYIYCEDTRQSKKLLNHYQISHPLQSLHAHSNDSVIEKALALMQQGETIAYMTDCGTPAVSDPGCMLVRAARAASFQVIPLPGASALTSLASVSGFPGKNIFFGGFLSKKQGKKSTELKTLQQCKGTIIVYESPHRILKALELISEMFPDKDILIGREMTKIFEEFILLEASRSHEGIADIKTKGEFCIAINNT